MKKYIITVILSIVAGILVFNILHPIFNAPNKYVTDFKEWDIKESEKENTAEEKRKEKEKELSAAFKQNSFFCDEVNGSVFSGSVECKDKNNTKNMANFINTKEIKGDLIINAPGISLENLSNLRYVDGMLSIHSDLDKSKLNGLNNLKTAYGLVISGSNIESLDPLKEVSFSENLSKNSEAYKSSTQGSGIYLNDTKIKVLPVFDNVKTIGYFGLLDNKYLTIDKKSFRNLETIKQIFLCIGNPKIKQIDGFNNVEYIGGRTSWVYDGLTFRKNESLNSITGFQNLKKVNGITFFVNNDSLETITGFSNLEKTTGLFIENNKKLKNVSGFASLKESHMSLTLKDNPKLLDISPLSNVKTTELVINTEYKYVKKFDKTGEMCQNIKIGNTPVFSVEKQLKQISPEYAFKTLCN